jgi:hypothetical protein
MQLINPTRLMRSAYIPRIPGRVGLRSYKLAVHSLTAPGDWLAQPSRAAYGETMKAELSKRVGASRAEVSMAEVPLDYEVLGYESAYPHLMGVRLPTAGVPLDAEFLMQRPIIQAQA